MVNFFIGSFIEELEKQAMTENQTKLLRNTLLNIGILADVGWIGKELIDVRKAKKQFEKEINMKSPKVKIPSGIQIVKTEKDLNNWVENNHQGNRLSKFFKKRILNGALKEKHNAFFVLPNNRQGRPAVLISSNASKVLKHELGHYQDALTHGIKTEKEFKSRVYRPYRSTIHSIFGKPENSPMYLAEVRAWNYAKVPEDDPLRQAALKTYRTNLMNLRPFVYTLPLAGIGSYLLSKGKIK